MQADHHVIAYYMYLLHQDEFDALMSLRAFVEQANVLNRIEAAF